MSSWSDRRRHRRKTDACQVVPYRNLIGERGDEAHATAAVSLMNYFPTVYWNGADILEGELIRFEFRFENADLFAFVAT